MKVSFFESHWKSDQSAAARLAKVLASGSYVGGQEALAFESEFSGWLGGRHVVGVNSGTDALYLAMATLGLGTRDEVVLPSYTFIACLSAVIRVGASPVLVDCAPGSFLPSLEQIGPAVTTATRAVLAVPLFGDTTGLPDLLAFCRERGLLLIEDVAQACGGYAAGDGHANRLAGTFGEASAFSFYPTKTLGAAGDSGAVTFLDPAHAERCRALSNHGLHAGEYREIGLNSRMDSIQATLLRAGLCNLGENLRRRREIAERYISALSRLPLLELPANTRGNAWNYFVVRHPRRHELRERLADLGVSTRIYYPQPIHRQPAYLAHFPAMHLPNCERLAEESLALPLYPTMTNDEVSHVIESVGQACNGLVHHA